MQQVKIDIYISDLLYRYDCVIIPDFGGFVANYSPAKIQAVQHKILPPSKQISFNKYLKNNDGLLSNYLAKKRELTFEEANQIIQSFVNQSLLGLNNGDKIVIEKVGTLYLDPEKNIRFKPEEKNDFLLHSFGLGALRVQPIQRVGAKERIEKQIEKTIPLIKKEEKKKRKYYWPAAAALLLLATSSILLQQEYGWLEKTNISYSGLGISKEVVAKYEPVKFKSTIKPVETELEPYKLVEGYANYTIENNSTSIVIDNRAEKVVTPLDHTLVVKNNSSKSLKFHVMGGCFSDLRNAENLVLKLKSKGFDARLLGEYKNLHAVSFGSFNSRTAAIELLNQVKSSENSAAWLLNKPF